MNPKKKTAPSRRSKRVCFSLTEEEFAAIASYTRKYKIDNRSRWLRETLLSHVWQKRELDYPTLFPENEMRR